MTRQLLALIAGVIALALFGSAFVGIGLARDSLQSQAEVRNADAATLMALALSQQRGDLELMSLLLAAQFDAGHYQSIRLRAEDGSLPFDRSVGLAVPGVPPWLVQALPIDVAPGVAMVSDGWRPVGRIELRSHPAWAYQALWTATQRLAGWLLAVGALAALVAAAAVRHWRRGLDDVVAQAQALEGGRFVAISEPRTGELKRLAAGMNSMVQRVRTMFEQQSGQLEVLRRHAQTDALTGLSNRGHFVAQLERALVGRQGGLTLADAPRRGALLLVRLHDLEAMNQRIGHEAADRLLASIGEVLRAYPDRVEGAFAGRLNGRDLALYLPVNGVARETAEAIGASLRLSLGAVDPAAAIAVGAVDALPTGAVSEAFAIADEALARAERQGPFSCVVLDDDRPAGQPNPSHAGTAIGEALWRQRIAQALAAGRAKLAEYPVVDSGGRLLHLECPLRVQLMPGGAYEAAARWLPMASRSRLIQRVDLLAADLALAAIENDGQPRAVHVAAESIAESGFAIELARCLGGRPSAAPRLLIEVSEQAAAHPDRLAQAAALWRPHGVKLGLENAGSSLQLLLAVRSLGLDHLKVDGRFLRGVAVDGRTAAYARQVLVTAGTIGLPVLAAGIDNAADLLRLWELGYAGATGPAVTGAAAAEA